MRGKAMNVFYRALIFCLLSGASGSVLADQSFRCGAHLIKEGMHKSKVLEYCGQPMSESGDTWVYDQGPEKFNMIVHFLGDDSIDRIEAKSDD
jgi:hypothetical protein